MNATATSPGVLAQVRLNLDQGRTAEQTVRAIRLLPDPPGPSVPVERTDRGWTVLRAAAWGRHDDPELS